MRTPPIVKMESFVLLGSGSILPYTPSTCVSHPYIVFYPFLLIVFLNPSTLLDSPTLKKIKAMDFNVF